MSEKKLQFAEVAVPLPLDKTFHYRIPGSISSLVPGMRVVVPFGRRPLTGYVVGLADTTAFPGIKDIISVVDAEPVLSGELLRLARWMSETCLCSLGEALATIAPGALRAPKRPAKDAAPAGSTPAPGQRPTLTPSQQAAVDAVNTSIDAGTHAALLLHGVTSSGKTEVYLATIEQALTHGRSAVFLLPEISLTPQFITIVKRRFPGIVGIWHSKLSPGERYAAWDAARTGRLKIMLGARSALFAPFKDLGLIIVDEEHEPTYKQEQKPSYHVREVAIERARLNSAVALFGSATPSLDIYYRARAGEIRLLEMRERVVDRALPPVTIVDPQRLKKRSRILSEPLIEALTRVLARREQAIVFLNRRGFSPGIMCHNCGEVWQCPHCSVSLVYHKNPEGLRCHYCDYTQPWPGICPHCKSRDIAVFGVGTQKVEEELKRLFPQARIFRLDRDSAAKKGVYEKAYEDFRTENVDILLGTQMVAKGFDFPRVTLVGAVDADTALYLPDFRSAERTFQLITQVAGRSGRGSLGGEVIVQSRHPEHYALRCAQKHDYAEFYRQEIDFRRQLNYPPFCRLVNFLFRGKSEEKVEEAAQRFGGELAKHRTDAKTSFDILGPAPGAYAKLHGLFRWQIVLKGAYADLIAAARAARTWALPSGVLLSIDVDPQDTL